MGGGSSYTERGEVSRSGFGRYEMTERYLDDSEGMGSEDEGWNEFGARYW